MAGNYPDIFLQKYPVVAAKMQNVPTVHKMVLVERGMERWSLV